MTVLTQTFNQPEDFAALRAAWAWCEARGVSVGRHQQGAPCGLLLGEFDIQKWRNLSPTDIKALDGRIIGGRTGPVEIYLTRRAAAQIVHPAARPATTSTQSAP